MLSLDQCRKKLNKTQHYSDEELLVIRDVLYQLAKLDYLIYQEIQKDEKKSDCIHKSIHRRAS